MRTDVSFPSREVRCKGWLYLPDDLPQGRRTPAIAMAHGFSAVKEMFLERFAERFAAEGFAVLVFDFRFLGESEGKPRAQILPHEQHEDYRNAITWLSRRPEIDPERIGIWGTSYSGGHVLHLAAFDPRVKAAVAQVPAVGIWKQMLHANGREALQGLLAMLTLDRIARFDGGAVNTMKVVAPPGEPCVLATPDAWEWFQEHGDAIASTWENRVSIESLERMIEYDPAGAIELVSPTPLQMIVAEHDSLIPIDVARQAFERAGEPKQLTVLPCGHFDVYATEPWFSRASDAAAEWFKAHLG
ncbi:MAG: alpha/beta hydrolase [Myxococcales bacterium]|nr:alpha/beta hydrolase [Myxococcales bacterium]